MATKISIVDDLDGTEPAETKDFTYDGVAYEIDLSAANVKKFDKDMEKWINAARKAGKSTGMRRTRIRTPQSRADNDAIRAWAKGKGKTVSDRGRVPKDIVDAFNEDHAGSQLFSGSGV